MNTDQQSGRGGLTGPRGAGPPSQDRRGLWRIGGLGLCGRGRAYLRGSALWRGGHPAGEWRCPRCGWSGWRGTSRRWRTWSSPRCWCHRCPRWRPPWCCLCPKGGARGTRQIQEVLPVWSQSCPLPNGTFPGSTWTTDASKTTSPAPLCLRRCT